MEQQLQEAMFGAGCFWGVEETFRKISGVVETAVGYSGGHVDNPTYEQVCRKETGHTEVVWVKFDPEQVSYEQLLEVFWGNHNPTTLNRQGPDIGEAYRSVVFYYDDEQKQLAEEGKNALDASGSWKNPVVTAIEPAKAFWRAEEYHQKFLQKRGGGTCGI